MKIDTRGRVANFANPSLESKGQLLQQDLSHLRDALLDSLTGCIALLTAAECDMLEQLADGPVRLDSLRMPGAGGDVLLQLLAQNNVILLHTGQPVQLTPEFAALWTAEGADLLARVSFTLMAARDMIDGRRAYFASRKAFMGGAQTYGFFCYNRAQGTRVGNMQDCAPWVDYVSALNAVEADPLVPLVPMDGVSRVLEIGGNTGGFARALLDAHPNAQACVFDLPAVCALGRDRAATGAVTERLTFVAGDARVDPLPGVDGQSPDLVLFKSVLHDWDDTGTRDLMSRAVARLQPGGKLVVLERSRLDHSAGINDFASAANLVFADFYRDPEWYRNAMQGLGLAVDILGPKMLDMPFYAITGEATE